MIIVRKHQRFIHAGCICAIRANTVQLSRCAPGR